MQPEAQRAQRYFTVDHVIGWAPMQRVPATPTQNARNFTSPQPHDNWHSPQPPSSAGAEPPSICRTKSPPSICRTNSPTVPDNSPMQPTQGRYSDVRLMNGFIPDTWPEMESDSNIKFGEEKVHEREFSQGTPSYIGTVLCDNSRRTSREGAPPPPQPPPGHQYCMCTSCGTFETWCATSDTAFGTMCHTCDEPLTQIDKK